MPAAIVFPDVCAALPYKSAVIGYAGWVWSDQVLCNRNTNGVLNSTAGSGSFECAHGVNVTLGNNEPPLSGAIFVVYHGVTSLLKTVQMSFSSSSTYSPKKIIQAALTGFLVGWSPLLPYARSILFGSEWFTGDRYFFPHPPPLPMSPTF